MEKAEVGMNGKTTTALSLATLLVVVVAGYRWWAASNGELAASDIGKLEQTSERDRVGPSALAEPEQAPSREPADAPDDVPARSEASVEPLVDTSSEAPLPGSLNVSVVFADGAPAQGISVSLVLRRRASLQHESASSTKGRATQRRASDADGRAVFAELWPGEYLVMTDRSQTNAQLVEIASGETEVVTLSLSGRDLEVIVVDARDVPIAEATVLLSAWPPMEAPAEVGRTDSSGILAVRAAPLACAVAATKAGYSTSRSYTLEKNSPLQSVLIRLDVPGGALEGCVRGPDGSEVAEARVTAVATVHDNSFAQKDGFNTKPRNTWQTIADSTGCFALDLAPGDMRVAVSSDDPDHAPWSGSCVIVEGNVTRLDVQLAQAAQCWGTVRTLSGEPSSGSKVEVSSAKGWVFDSTRTDGDGAFALGHIPAGEFVLSARSEDGASARVALFARAGDSIHQDLDLADVQMFRGRVVDSLGEGIPKLTIIAMASPGDWGRSTNTDESGAFAITEVPEQGVLRLIVQKNGAELARQEWQLPIAGPVEVAVDEISLGAIRGRIVDAAGTIIGHARITPRLVSSATARIHTTEMGSGVFAIGDLAEGSYAIVVQASGFENLSTDVYVRGDETTDLGDLVMTRRP